MCIFRISIVAKQSDHVVNIGAKVWIDEIEADFIKETVTGYALCKYGTDTIVYTVPAGLIVERV